MDAPRTEPIKATAEHLEVVGTRARPPDRSTGEILRSIAAETSTLIRKEIELGKQELLEALTARLIAVGAAAVAAICGLFILAFLGLAAATALDNVLRPWASRLIVAGIYLVVAGAGGLVAVTKIKRPPMAPEETVRTVKEDVEWAKTQLKR
jgi:uncharacterized membrane protein YqjE